MDRMVSPRHGHGSKVETLCLVCGDKASGRHYGVPSCDGCRGFFKRSIRRNLDYVCKESNKCVVDVSRRNQCQSCRFRRCLEVNMKRDAVQHERAPRGSLKRSYPSDSLSSATVTPTPSIMSNQPSPQTPMSVGQHFYHGSFPFHPWQPALDSVFGHVPGHFPLTVIAPPLAPASSPTRLPAAVTVGSIKEDEVSSSANDSTIINKRRDTDGVGHKPNKTCATTPPAMDSRVGQISLNFTHRVEDRDPLYDVNEGAARLLFLAVRWTRTIPSFVHLSFRDQSLLLEEAWCELFVLTIAQWGLNLDEVNILRSCPEVANDRQEALLDALQQLRQMVGRIHYLRLDHTEFACLKALVLFKSETRRLRDCAAVELLQDQTQIMLHEYCTAGPSHHHLVASVDPNLHPTNAPGRFGKVLLTLPALRSIPSSCIVDLFFRKLIGDTPMARLLADLLMGSF